MHTRYLPVILLVCLSFLSGCGPLLIRDEARNAYVPINAGTFELHKPVTIRADRTRAYLQDGAVVPSVDEFRPHCQLDINTLKAVPRTVEPGQFTVTRISLRTDEIVHYAPLQVAALAMRGMGSSNPFDSGLPRRMLVYLFFLHSDRQPDVRALICGGAFDDPSRAERPTLGEIARSLGTYGTLRLE